MERRVPSRGEIRGGYPMRAIRAREFLYIRDFQPGRWPVGDPDGLAEANARPFSSGALATQTFKALADIDASPTKAHMVRRRSEPGIKPLYELAAGKCPERELYDLGKDPFQMNNVAGGASYGEALKRLDAQSMAELEASGDPRAHARGEQLDRYFWYQRRGAGRK
jgi:uncharacterized sulfatase